MPNRLATCPRPRRARIESLVRLVFALLLMLASPAGANDLSHLSDEFNNPFTLPLWLRIHDVEQWGAEQNETYDIDASRPGWLTMVPYTCTWYQDWRGPMAFKRVGGDFVVTASLEARARDGVSIPNSLFSLGGLMIRTPRNITPATWTPGGENYVFLSLGYGNAVPRRWQYEVKNTISGNSNLILSDATGPLSRLQIARVGNNVICLRRDPAGPWRVHQRYFRPDFPETLQVGAVAYTDWNKSQIFVPFVHNGATLRVPLPPGVTDPNPAIPFSPDLIARWDYLRFFRPSLPAHLVGVDLTNAGLVPDAELLAFLGAVADSVCPQAGVVDEPLPSARLTLRVVTSPPGGAPALRFRVPAGVGYRLDLFDVTGRHAARLGTGEGGGDEREVRWPGATVRAAGVYLVRLVAGGETRAVRVVYSR